MKSKPEKLLNTARNKENCFCIMCDDTLTFKDFHMNSHLSSSLCFCLRRNPSRAVAILVLVPRLLHLPELPWWQVLAIRPHRAIHDEHTTAHLSNCSYILHVQSKEEIILGLPCSNMRKSIGEIFPLCISQSSNFH